MSTRSRKLVEFSARLALATLLAIGILCVSAVAQTRWQTLPPTPKLPAHASSGHVDRRDALIWYATFGDDSKPAVLLLHGGAGSSDYWGHLVRDLMRDFHVIVFDCRGQGRSTNDAPAISYEQMAADAIAVIDQLGVENAHVVGWSDGANIGFHLALNFPARISSLIAFAGNVTPAGYQTNEIPDVMSAYQARTRSEYDRLSPHPKRRGEVLRLLSLMWKTEPSFTLAQLRTVRTRTTILHAEHDEIIRQSHSREIASSIPNAKFVLLRGVGHFGLIQNRGAFNKEVRAALSSPR